MDHFSRSSAIMGAQSFCAAGWAHVGIMLSLHHGEHVLPIKPMPAKSNVSQI